MLDNYFGEEDIFYFRSWMEWADNFVIVSHKSPDGDAVGSSLAMALYLKAKGKNVVVALPDAAPDCYSWMPGMGDVLLFDRDGGKVEALLGKADVICCLDFNQIGRVSGMAAPLLYSKAKKIMIDHHIGPGPFCDVTLSRPEASATCELVCHFLCALGEWNVVTREMAECLCAGMMTDTGGFVYNSSHPGFFYLISQLVEKDVDKDALYRKLFYCYSEDRLRMLGYATSQKLVVVPGSNVAYIALTQEEMDRFHSRKGDTEGLVNMPLQISGVKMTAFFREDAVAGRIKVSLRSVGDVPCNRFASAYFGGGGHLNASGGEFDGSMEECVNTFLRGLEEWRKSSAADVAPLFVKNK